MIDLETFFKLLLKDLEQNEIEEIIKEATQQEK